MSNIAHASVAVTLANPADQVVSVLTTGSGTLQFSTTPLVSDSVGVAVAGGEQAYTSVTGNSGTGQPASASGSATITDLTLNANTGALFGQLPTGGTVTLNNGGGTPLNSGSIEVTSPLIVGGDGSGSSSTITISPPAPLVTVQPIEPPPLGWVTPPFFPTPAPAYPQQAGMTCSGAFSVSFGANTTVNCQADLWFTNGYFAANQSIVANALGNILVDDVSFVAPLIQFNAGANFVTSLNPIWLDGNTTINALGVNIAGPLQTTGTSSLSINSQTINLNPAIPEPSTWALMGLGLLGLSLAARRKA